MVKASDSKSDFILKRRFESYQLRFPTSYIKTGAIARSCAGYTWIFNFEAKLQNSLLCDSDQAVSRGIQRNKFLELLDGSCFEESNT